MDLYMWELRLDKVEEKGGFHPMIQEAARKVREEHGVTIRHMRKRDFEAELGRFLEVYNAAWERNWGFVPLNEKEVRHYAKDLKPILDENWTWIAERDGEILGASLTLPDINQAPGPHERPAAARSGGRSSSGTGGRSTAAACSRWASSPSTSTSASPPPSTSSTSRRPATPPTASGGARWAGSSRPTSP